MQENSPRRAGWSARRGRGKWRARTGRIRTGRTLRSENRADHPWRTSRGMMRERSARGSMPPCRARRSGSTQPAGGSLAAGFRGARSSSHAATRDERDWPLARRSHSPAAGVVRAGYRAVALAKNSASWRPSSVTDPSSYVHSCAMRVSGPGHDGVAIWTFSGGDPFLTGGGAAGLLLHAVSA
jgi:hypothetical protein